MKLGSATITSQVEAALAERDAEITNLKFAIDTKNSQITSLKATLEATIKDKNTYEQLERMVRETERMRRALGRILAYTNITWIKEECKKGLGRKTRHRVICILYRSTRETNSHSTCTPISPKEGPV